MKLTIAQLRELEIEKLVAFRTDRPTEDDYREARRLMNSFYRLCGLSETNLYLANNEYTCNRKSTAESEARESRWYDRLSNEFKEFCGLQLFYAGYAPSIGIVTEHGGVSEKINRWFYC